MGDMEGGSSKPPEPLWIRHCMVLFSLFRKHSSGDLHSRLKTRKLLGVGETDDGDVHRSKVRKTAGLQIFSKVGGPK